MIRFESADLFEIELPMRRDFKMSWAAIGSRRLVLVKFHTSLGPIWTECGALNTPGYHPETVDDAYSILESRILPDVLGKSYPDPESLGMAIESIVPGNRFAKATVETAGWWVKAMASNESLAQVLGSSQEWVPTGAVVGAHREIEDLVKEVETLIAQGYRRIKLKLMPYYNGNTIRAVNAVKPPRVQLFADANGMYAGSDIDRVVDICNSGLDLLEQPFSKNQLWCHALLQSRVAIPICLDESIESSSDIVGAVERRACQAVTLKYGRLGGIAEISSAWRTARQLGIEPWVGGMFETGIGRLVTAAIAAAVDSRWVSDLSLPNRYWDNDLIEGPKVEDGMLSVGGAQYPSLLVDESCIQSRSLRNKRLLTRSRMNYS